MTQNHSGLNTKAAEPSGSISGSKNPLEPTGNGRLVLFSHQYLNSIASAFSELISVPEQCMKKIAIGEVK